MELASDFLWMTWFWIGIGLGLCIMELLIPTAFAELMMGLSALIVAVLSLWIFSFGLQVFLWMVLSLIGIVIVRRFMPRRLPKILQNPEVAETLTALQPEGRVLYEGSSWQARCDNPSLAIAPQQKVHVVRREGTTLVVMPMFERPIDPNLVAAPEINPAIDHPTADTSDGE